MCISLDPDKVEVDRVLKSLIDDKKLTVYRGKYIVRTSDERHVRRCRFVDELELNKGKVEVSPANLTPDIVAMGDSASGMIRIVNTAFEETFYSLVSITVDDHFAAMEDVVRVVPCSLVDKYEANITSGRLG